MERRREVAAEGVDEEDDENNGMGNGERNDSQMQNQSQSLDSQGQPQQKKKKRFDAKSALKENIGRKGARLQTVQVRICIQDPSALSRFPQGKKRASSPEYLADHCHHYSNLYPGNPIHRSTRAQAAAPRRREGIRFKGSDG